MGNEGHLNRCDKCGQSLPVEPKAIGPMSLRYKPTGRKVRVWQVWTDYVSGMKRKDMAKKYGVSGQRVYQLWKNHEFRMRLLFRLGKVAIAFIPSEPFKTEAHEPGYVEMKIRPGALDER